MKQSKRTWAFLAMCVIAGAQAPLDGCCGGAEAPAAPIRLRFDRTGDADGGVVITGPVGRVPSASECTMLCGEVVMSCVIVQRMVTAPLAVECTPVNVGGRSGGSC
jgi:hypothetical protein